MNFLPGMTSFDMVVERVLRFVFPFAKRTSGLEETFCVMCFHVSFKFIFAATSFGTLVALELGVITMDLVIMSQQTVV